MLDRFEKKQYNEGLTEAVDSIAGTLQRSGAARATHRTPVGPQPRLGNNSGSIMSNNLYGWLCFAVVALLVIWMIAGLIRASAADQEAAMEADRAMEAAATGPAVMVQAMAAVEAAVSSVH